MAINLGSNFNMTTTLPLDNRSVVADLTARDALAAGVRYEGMLVYVEAEETNFQLVGGIDNADWAELSGGGADGGTFIIGPDLTEGSWRLTVVSDNLQIEVYASGNWVLKQRLNK